MAYFYMEQGAVDCNGLQEAKEKNTFLHFANNAEENIGMPRSRSVPVLRRCSSPVHESCEYAEHAHNKRSSLPGNDELSQKFCSPVPFADGTPSLPGSDEVSQKFCSPVPFIDGTSLDGLDTEEFDARTIRIKSHSCWRDDGYNSVEDQTTSVQAQVDVAGDHTLLIKGIPHSWTGKDVLKAIEDLGFGGQHNFFHLPKLKGGNRGYALVGFADPQITKSFENAMQRYNFRGSSLPQVVTEPAVIQTLANNCYDVRSSPVDNHGFEEQDHMDPINDTLTDESSWQAFSIAASSGAQSGVRVPYSRHSYEEKYDKVLRRIIRTLEDSDLIKEVVVCQDFQDCSIILRTIGDTSLVLEKAQSVFLEITRQSKSIYVMGFSSARPFTPEPPLGFSAQLGAMENAARACWHVFKKGYCRHGDNCSKQHAVYQGTVRVCMEIA